MAQAPLNLLLEENLKSAVHSWWPTGVAAPQIYGTAGGQLPEFPALRFQLGGTEEFPERTRNFFCEVNVNLSSSLDHEGSGGYSYSEMIDNHMSVAGHLEDWLANYLDTTDLEETIDGYNNSLAAHQIIVTSWTSDIDPSDGLLAHNWTLRIFAFHGLATT